MSLFRLLIVVVQTQILLQLGKNIAEYLGLLGGFVCTYPFLHQRLYAAYLQLFNFELKAGCVVVQTLLLLQLEKILQNIQEYFGVIFVHTFFFVEDCMLCVYNCFTTNLTHILIVYSGAGENIALGRGSYLDKVLSCS